MRRKVEVVILCEDEDHYQLLRLHLIERGYNPPTLRRVVEGTFSNVIAAYSREVREQRRRATFSETVSLVVVIDADVGEVEQRHQQLAAQLDAAGLAPRNASERIALVVPRRNVETWIVFLCGSVVDELTKYEKPQSADDRRQAAKALAGACAKPTSSEPPSLRRSCSELKRLPG